VTASRTSAGGGSLAAAGRSIWLAGVGALAEASDAGRALFDELVERGRRLETRQFRSLDRAVARTADRVERAGAGVKGRIERTVESVVHRADLPSRRDLRELSARLDRLAERIDELDRSAPAVSRQAENRPHIPERRAER